ncbi:hypothetical protein [Flavobacterium lacus]|uniref:YopA central domain-containing protein n=1 Tax=Flavobacterium lacus TaxID=1353778 RepID=A0A328WWY9_9FLAO|nr:hypothetical protein [Flavobacterium lacus]RAR50890.1 hypothetical protein B0I10_10158 [Flavobacterium lacus]
MTKEELEDYKNNIPEINESIVEMEKANSQIVIYEGEYVIKYADNEIKIVGKVYFDWFPNFGTYFSGKPLIDVDKAYDLFHKVKMFEIIIDDLKFGDAFITRTNIQSLNGEINFIGVLSQQAIFGDKSIPVKTIRFSVPNLREFYGLPVKKQTVENISHFSGRLILENNNFLIKLDKLKNYAKLSSSLEESGGYVVLYAGEIESKKGSMTFETVKDTFHCLDTFLTFLNGRRTSALFITGMHEGEKVWSDFTGYHVDAFKSVLSWPQRHSIAGINELWQKFCELWKDKDDKNFLTSAIHWYIEANNHSGFTEGSIIMAQTALELLYNWWIIENKKIIIGKDSEIINASNKIRLLLSQLDIDYLVPQKFSELQSFIDSDKQIIDAPDAVVQIRNAIVHSQEEKRKKLSSIHYKAKSEALNLCIWYIEMSILRILEYNGKYYNRCSKELHRSLAEEIVPWKR